MPWDDGTTNNSGGTARSISAVATAAATPTQDSELEEGDAFDETKSLLSTTTFRPRKSSRFVII